jgi:hypothetical protein
MHSKFGLLDREPWDGTEGCLRYSHRHMGAHDWQPGQQPTWPVLTASLGSTVTVHISNGPTMIPGHPGDYEGRFRLNNWRYKRYEPAFDTRHPSDVAVTVAAGNRDRIDWWVFVVNSYRPYDAAQDGMKPPPAPVAYSGRSRPLSATPYAPLSRYAHVDFPAQRAHGARFEELRAEEHCVHRRVPAEGRDTRAVRREYLAEMYGMSSEHRSSRRNFISRIMGPNMAAAFQDMAVHQLPERVLHPTGRGASASDE